MRKDTRHRRYMMTINNNTVVWTHDMIKDGLAKMNLKYWCMADEIGAKEKTHHTHVYFVAETSPIAFSRVKKLFPSAHIEPARATSIDCKNYVAKQGKWYAHEKHETSIEGTFEEFGEVPIENQGNRTDWDIAYSMLQNGQTVEDIIRWNTSFIKNRRHLEETRQQIIEEEYKDIFRNLDIVYIYGKTATGKTRYVMEKYGYSNVCQITGYRYGCFDKYNCEDVILFDEFKDSFPLQDMNNYLDGYPLHLPCRYTNKIACYTKVYIISNILLENQYSEIRKKNRSEWDTVIRRIKKVYMFTDVGEYEEYDTQEYMKMVDEREMKK